MKSETVAGPPNVKNVKGRQLKRRMQNNKPKKSVSLKRKKVKGGRKVKASAVPSRCQFQTPKEFSVLKRALGLRKRQFGLLWLEKWSLNVTQNLRAALPLTVQQFCVKHSGFRLTQRLRFTP
jgi:hypothetical protein